MGFFLWIRSILYSKWKQIDFKSNWNYCDLKDTTCRVPSTMSSSAVKEHYSEIKAACQFSGLSSNGQKTFPRLTLYGHIKTGLLYISTVIGTLAVGWWAVTLVQLGGAWAGGSPAQSPPRSTKCNSQRPVYQLHIIRYRIIIASGL